MNIKNLIYNDNVKYVIKLSMTLIILFLVIYILIPKFKMGNVEKVQYDTLLKKIDTLNIQQNSLNSKIKDYYSSLDTINDKLRLIKNEKIIIKEIFNEKINSVDHYDDDQIDSFLSDRYSEYYQRNSN